MAGVYISQNSWQRQYVVEMPVEGIGFHLPDDLQTTKHYATGPLTWHTMEGYFMLSSKEMYLSV